jgi:hypothetical protein
VLVTMNRVARRSAVTAASAVLLISGFAAVASAQGGSSKSPSPSEGARPSGAPGQEGPGGPGRGHGPRGFGGPGGGFGFGFGAPGLGRGLLHGDGVVKKQDGTFATESFQTGKASKVTATSITVTSDDSFERTYVIGKDTRQPGTAAKDGDTVVVVALKVGAAYDAQSVLVPGSFKGRGGRPFGDHPRPPMPSGSAPASVAPNA